MLLTFLAAAAAAPTDLPRLVLPIGELECKAGDASCAPTTSAPQPCVGLSGDANFLCRALDASKGNRFEESASNFEQAAAAKQATATVANNAEVNRLYAAAGNMWIAADKPEKAAFALDRALVGDALQGEQRGFAQLDRARAAEAQNDFATARRMVASAVSTIDGDPFLWYFSAALAIREGDPATAKTAITRALQLAPDSPEIMFEAGHVAKVGGDEAGARDWWNKAIAADKDGPTAKAAREALALADRPRLDPAK